MHPYFDPQLSDLDALEALLDQPKVIVLGEIGLHGPLGNLGRQQQLLEAQLKIAQERQLPVVLHQVQAHQEMVASLQRVPPQWGGVVHAFSGSLEMAQTYHEKFALKIGVGGIITYPRAQKTRRAMAHIDASAIVLETDAPDMPLSGFQGMRNSPLQIPNVFRALCQLRGLTTPAQQAYFAEQLEHNAQALWHRHPALS
jgi:TatD DNase family protein